MHRSAVSIIACLTLAATAAADPAGPAEGPGSSTSSTGGDSPRISNKLNPAVSFNGLLRGAWRKADTQDGGEPASPLAGPETGLALEEAELILSASVDPYFKADAIVALEDAAAEGGEGYEVDLEEAYVTLLSLPRGLGLRAGKMFMPFGRHNLLHRHQYPFIQAALMNERLLGHEGLNEAALELSWLAPLSWYSQLRVAVADGRNEALFGEARSQDLAYLLHYKNVWDVTDDATLELGASGIHGKRGDTADASTRAFGVNVTYKWRPARRSAYRALEVQAELLHRDRDPLEHDDDHHHDRAEPRDDHGHSDELGELADRATGGYLHVRWQFARRWWLQGRYDRIDYDDGHDEARTSLLVAFLPSHMSALRFEYATLDPIFGDRDHQIIGQLIFNIGSHPAHGY